MAKQVLMLMSVLLAYVAVSSAASVMTTIDKVYSSTDEQRVVQISPESSLCEPQSSGEYRAHPDDCAKFTLCSASGVLISLTCASGSVFHNKSKSCVPKGSVYDTCTPQTTSQQICPPGATYLQPHPKECAMYYDCGSDTLTSEHWEQHLRECEYPMLYNPNTTRCEHYSMVTCGLRREPFDPCEYKANTCDGHAMCRPCSVQHPSCRGKEDGMNIWEGRTPSPYYVVCAAQRVVFQGMCSQEHGTQIFDNVTGTCAMTNSV